MPYISEVSAIAVKSTVVSFFLSRDLTVLCYLHIVLCIMHKSMFTQNQIAILSILVDDLWGELTMSDLGRLLGKAPGTFQRGLNALVDADYIRSRRHANLRLFSFNTSHPLADALAIIVQQASLRLPVDLHISSSASEDGDRIVPGIAEPPGIYSDSAKKIVIIAGPNGVGKTTFAREFLPREAACDVFINADYIAHGLSPFKPELAAIKAGKIMLQELNEHIDFGHNVAVETTLSGRRYARCIPQWQARGYAVKLIFLSLPSVELAMARVEIRVRQGGHSIPKAVIKRRFVSGRQNFETIYKPLVDCWAVYDNSGGSPLLIEEWEKMKKHQPIKDPDLRGVEPALRRAAIAAQRIAKATNTPLIIWENNKIVRKWMP